MCHLRTDQVYRGHHGHHHLQRSTLRKYHEHQRPCSYHKFAYVYQSGNEGVGTKSNLLSNGGIKVILIITVWSRDNIGWSIGIQQESSGV